ncbi:MAG TPA: hypothetical protein VGX48_22690 [Pyrinomonadaceae bacterium]|jgi:hypothetical protein|nr:hypothetical protein [Pyrinomonadaceae bacterium]
MAEDEVRQEPLSEPTRGRLNDVRRALLRLHKTLLDAERVSYERGRGSVGGSGEFLQLVLNDPWFAWLRPLSELVVRIDELLEPAEPAPEAEARAALRQAEELIRPAGGGGEFGRRYREALQQSPDVVLAHGELSRLLPRPSEPETMSESEIDETLAQTFPASDPPSWTLGTDHGDPEK